MDLSSKKTELILKGILNITKMLFYAGLTVSEPTLLSRNSLDISLISSASNGYPLNTLC